MIYILNQDSHRVELAVGFKKSEIKTQEISPDIFSFS